MTGESELGRVNLTDARSGAAAAPLSWGISYFFDFSKR
jgi:hypothetical protein